MANPGAAKFVRDKSVVLLFLQGGPSQIETFDPKMTAPSEVRSINGETPTTLPGITFGATFPKLAALPDKLAVVRSFASENADHQNYIKVSSGDNPLKVPMSTLYARLAGAVRRDSGLPDNTVILPEAVMPGLKLPSNFETQSLQKLLTAGQGLGATNAAFDPSGGNSTMESLKLSMPRDRFDDRRGLLAQLDSFKSQAEKTRAFDLANDFEVQAFDAIVGSITSAFDLSKEDPKTIAAFDTSSLFTQAEVNKWHDMKRSSNQLGKQLLLARRLCEAGCGYVTVMDAGWDMHCNNNSPPQLAGMKWPGAQLDHAVAAFLKDVTQRGLSDKILLVVTGEMGRGPKRDKNGGRGHWANLTPLLLAGGGLKMGQVIGKSDSQAGSPASQKYTPQHLFGTVMRTLFDLNELRVKQGIPKYLIDMAVDSKAIPELF